jgi:two-component system, LytTR family, sensor kinase
VNRSLLLHTQNWRISLVWWLFWCFAQTTGLHRVGESWQDSFIQAGLTVVALALVEFIIANTYSYYRPAANSLVLLIGSTIIMTVITGHALMWSFLAIYRDNPEHAQFIEKYMPMRVMFILLMISLMIIFYWFRNKFLEYNEVKQRQEDAERLLREAELSRLRQQLQPHFLFNSLNSISALAGTKPEQARHMVQQLSDFLRGTLRKDEQQLVPLDEEFRHLQLYLEIEKVRFGHRLKTNLVWEEPCIKMKLPSLLLQPVMENAVKFGLYDTIGEITIEMKATCEKDMLVIEVRNPFDPDTSGRRGTGFGLTSVKRRLYLLYARHDLLETSAENNVFTTILKIPQKP